MLDASSYELELRFAALPFRRTDERVQEAAEILERVHRVDEKVEVLLTQEFVEALPREYVPLLLQRR